MTDVFRPALDWDMNENWLWVMAGKRGKYREDRLYLLSSRLHQSSGGAFGFKSVENALVVVASGDSMDDPLLWRYAAHTLIEDDDELKLEWADAIFDEGMHTYILGHYTPKEEGERYSVLSRAVTREIEVDQKLVFEYLYRDGKWHPGPVNVGNLMPIFDLSGETTVCELLSLPSHHSTCRCFIIQCFDGIMHSL